MTTSTRLTPRTFAGLVRTLDDDGLARFVADLYEENGWEVTVDGATLTANRADEGTNRLLAVADDRSVLGRVLGRHVHVDDSGEFDAVVLGYQTAEARGGPPTAAETIDADDLFHQVLYAVDRPTGAAICDRHFGGDIDTDAISRGSEVDSWLDRMRARTRGNSRRVVAAAVVLSLVLGAVTIGVTGLGGGPGTGPSESGVGGGTGQPATPVGMGANAALETTDDGGGIQTATPGEDGEVTPRSSYYFDTPRSALLTYVQLTNDADNVDDLRLAWRSTSVATRPSFDQFVESFQSGPRRWIASLSNFELAPLDHRPTPTDEPGLTRGYVGFYGETSRVVFRYEIVCRQHDEVAQRGCWQIRVFESMGFR